MRMRSVLLFFIILFALGACSPQKTAPTSDALQDDPQVTPTEEPVIDPPDGPFPTATEINMPDVSSVPFEKFVDLTKRDLAAQLNIDIDAISLTNSLQMTWPDASLGCPRPGEVYARGAVPGYKIWLMANQVEYIYHTDLTGRFVLCPDPGGDSGAPGPGPTITVPRD